MTHAAVYVPGRCFVYNHQMVASSTPRCQVSTLGKLFMYIYLPLVIGCEDCLRNDLYCVGWGVKLYSIQSCLPLSPSSIIWSQPKRTMLSGWESLCRPGG